MFSLRAWNCHYDMNQRVQISNKLGVETKDVNFDLPPRLASWHKLSDIASGLLDRYTTFYISDRRISLHY